MALKDADTTNKLAASDSYEPDWKKKEDWWKKKPFKGDGGKGAKGKGDKDAKKQRE